MVFVNVEGEQEMDMLQMFCDNSMFTFEGLDITNFDSNKELEALLKSGGYPDDKEVLCYHFSGKVMNKAYGLTGSNAYPDDLTFVVVPEFYNPIVKLASGARWFDDIVANNSIRQNAINSGCKPDYD